MKLLTYADLDATGVSKQLNKLKAQLLRDDFRSAEVKKLSGHDYYRARLDDTNRLLFTTRRYQGETYALLLEVIRQHAYDKSRFLRGAVVDEDKIPALQAPPAPEAELTYLNPEAERFFVLDKIISFDPDQDALFSLVPPLIIIGPAGSGKTAITLEKLKLAKGRALYVTLSPYLSQHASDLYRAHNYDNNEQEVEFYSFKEFVESFRVPEGKELSFALFKTWVARFPKHERPGDAHQLYEEFRGVITGSPTDKAYLARDEYVQLGVRQSVFVQADRERVYTLFERYLAHLAQSKTYDPNIVAFTQRTHVAPTYDFLVVDEVQDLTNAQLSFILASLKEPTAFLLCGDSNQVVHPNFFSWGSLKSMFYQASDGPGQNVQRVLQSNYRSAPAVTHLANQLLRIKQKRFGSIDKESNYLMRSTGTVAGKVELLVDKEAARNELNQKTRRSTRYAVLVMRDEQKAEARRYFDTPLLFSIHEAKGLEYENIILWNFVSQDRQSFSEVASGIDAADLAGDLTYSRGKDKSDKSSEVYKFFVNALYVAITRAVRTLYVLESDTGHPILQLLGLRTTQDALALEAEQSSTEAWQAEARRLEMQGKLEQAEDIRNKLLKVVKVPWEVWDSEKVVGLLERAQNPKDPSNKPKQVAFEYALNYDLAGMMEQLSTSVDRARSICDQTYWGLQANMSRFSQQKLTVLRRYTAPYEGKTGRDVLRACEQYGVDHRNTFNQTPLMLAVLFQNVGLVESLLAGGANPELVDNYGLTAWQHALYRAMEDPVFAKGDFVALHKLLRPSHVSIKADDRLVKLDIHQGEFWLFQAFLVLMRRKMTFDTSWGRGYASRDFVDAFLCLPEQMLPLYRRRQAYISGLLAKNEVNRDAPYNRRLFVRMAVGYYWLDPKLSVRINDEWRDIYELINVPLLGHTTGERGKHLLQSIKRLQDWRQKTAPSREGGLGVV